MGVYIQFPDISNLRLEKLVTWLPGFRAMHRRYCDLSDEIASPPMAPGNLLQQPLFSSLVTSVSRSKGQYQLSDSEIWAERVFLMLAGLSTLLMIISPTTEASVYFESHDY